VADGGEGGVRVLQGGGTEEASRAPPPSPSTLSGISSISSTSSVAAGGTALADGSGAAAVDMACGARSERVCESVGSAWGM
jgi:hypothetical protein